MATLLDQPFIGDEWTWSAESTTAPYTGASQGSTNNGALGAAINTSANYSGGQGGNGLIQRLGDGTNDQGPANDWGWAGTPQEIWVRFYMLVPSAMTLTPGYAKILDFQGVRVIFGLQAEVAGNFGFWQDSTPDYFMTKSGTFSGTAKSWSSLMGGNQGDGQWHCYEFHLKQAGAGSSEAHIWIDNEACGANTTCTINGSGGFSSFNFWTNQAVISGGADPYDIYMDDIVVSDSARIGPIANSTNGAALFLA